MYLTRLAILMVLIIAFILPSVASAQPEENRRLWNFRPDLTSPVIRQFLTTHILDISSLMNEEFQPDTFTSRETEIQRRIIAAREAAMHALSSMTADLDDITGNNYFQHFVTETVRKLIHLERNNDTEFRNLTQKLREFLSALNNNNAEQAASLLIGTGLYHMSVWSKLATYAANLERLTIKDAARKVGIYLKLQFAEALKDMNKASRHSGAEVLPQSTLISGGDALGLIYKPGGFMAQGWNHIRGLPNADMWHEGHGNWARVAGALRTALQ